MYGTTQRICTVRLRLIITLNRFQCVVAVTITNFQPPLICAFADLDGLARFVREFATRTLLPKLEDRVAKLNAGITATRRGLRNRITRLWKGAGDEAQSDKWVCLCVGEGRLAAYTTHSCCTRYIATPPCTTSMKCYCIWSTATQPHTPCRPHVCGALLRASSAAPYMLHLNLHLHAAIRCTTSRPPAGHTCGTQSRASCVSWRTLPSCCTRTTSLLRRECVRQAASALTALLCHATRLPPAASL